MKLLRTLCLLFAASALAAAALAADVTGTWKWNVATPNGEVETTLKLTTKDGKLAGAYSNSFGEAAISNPAFKDDTLAFEVERTLGGAKFVLKFKGKLDGDTLKGTIDVPAGSTAGAQTLDWNAKRAKEKSDAPTK